MLEKIKSKIGQGVKNKKVFKSFWMLTLLFTFTFGVLSPSIIPFTQSANNVAFAGDVPVPFDPLTNPVTGKPIVPLPEKKEEERVGPTVEAAKKLETKPSEKQTGFAEVVSLIVSISTPLVIIMTDLAGNLLGNKWIYGTGSSTDKKTFPMEDVLHNMWIIMRDLVNIVFILVLLAIAFTTVLGAGTPLSEKINYKTLLPKMVIALVAVNFTWFGAKVIIDASNVATHAVFGILQTVASSNLETGNIEMCIPKNIKIAKEEQDLDSPDNEAELERIQKEFNSVNAPNATLPKVKTSREAHQEAQKKIENNTIKCEDMPLRYPKYTIGSWGTYVAKIQDKMDATILLKLFAYGIWRIELLPLSIDENVNISNLVINSIFALIFMIMIIIVLFVLLVALLVRILMLWLNIVLSPIFALLWVVGDMGISTGGDGKNIGIMPFINFAFLPAMIAFPMVIGIVMIMAGQKITNGTTVVGDVDFREMINGINSMEQLFWYVMALVVMWGSTKMAADHGGDLTKMVVEPVTNTIQAGAKWAAQAPLYFPFIPSGRKTQDGKEGKFALGDIGVITKDIFTPHESKRRDALKEMGIIDNKTSIGDLKEGVRDIVKGLNKTDSGNILQLAEKHKGDEDGFKRAVNRYSGLGDAITKSGQGIGQVLDVITNMHGLERGDAYKTAPTTTGGAGAGASGAKEVIKSVEGKIQIGGEGVYARVQNASNINIEEIAGHIKNTASSRPDIKVDALVEQFAREIIDNKENPNAIAEEVKVAQALGPKLGLSNDQIDAIAKRINPPKPTAP